MSLQDTLGTTYAFIFPGQGSQSVGMGKDLAHASDIARETMEQADAILDTPLTQLCFEGPEDELNDTYNSQAAIFTVGIAALRTLEHKAAGEDIVLAPMMVAGHSLGQITALVAAGVLEFETALKLVRERGRLMKEAGDEHPGGMIAVLGMDEDILARLVDEAAQGQALTIANRNCPGQIVISGEVSALDRFTELAKDAGARKMARLPISIASHSSLMEDAAHQLNELFDQITFRDPTMPVIANSTGERLNTGAEIREEMRNHVVNGVDWTGTIQTMIANGITTFVEIGHGSVLAGLNRRIDRNTKTLSLKDLELPSA
ncbi:MAG TPA: ACP S-malonyltransferase [Thermomicrobiales bacterium]|nr:ACP S-malonyltransferase [Thermomicrobiales bacterium]